MRAPFRGQIQTRALPRQRHAFRGPLLVALGQQRQVEQPFAGIVHDVERQRALRAVVLLVVDHQPQFADVGRRVRPFARLQQRAQMILIGETRHVVVGLRRQPRLCDASCRQRLEHRETPAAGQRVDQGGDEHRLAGA